MSKSSPANGRLRLRRESRVRTRLAQLFLVQRAMLRFMAEKIPCVRELDNQPSMWAAVRERGGTTILFGTSSDQIVQPLKQLIESPGRCIEPAQARPLPDK